MLPPENTQIQMPPPENTQIQMRPPGNPEIQMPSPESPIMELPRHEKPLLCDVIFGLYLLPIYTLRFDLTPNHDTYFLARLLVNSIWPNPTETTEFHVPGRISLLGRNSGIKQKSRSWSTNLDSNSSRSVNQSDCCQIKAEFAAVHILIWICCQINRDSSPWD